MVKNPPANTRDMGSSPGSGRSPREGNDNPLQDSCLENPMDRGAWWAAVHGSDTTERLHFHFHLGNLETRISRTLALALELFTPPI